MNELRRILRHQLRALVGLAALGCLVHLQVAQAQEVSDAAFNRFRSQVVGNTVNFSYGAGGTPLGGAGNATGIGVTSGVDVGRAVAINTKHGPVNGTLTQKISNAAMGRAFARAGAFIGGPVGLAFLALPAIVEWMSDADVERDPSSGAFTQEQAVGYLTRWCSGNYGSYCGNGVTPVQACTAIRSTVAGGANGPVAVSYRGGTEGVSGHSLYCGFNAIYINNSGMACSAAGPFISPAPSCGSAPVQLTEQQLGDAMAAANPSPEALSELYRLGEFIPTAHPIPDLIDTLRADFEARSPESTETSTTDTPSETKTEEKTCATYTQVVGSTLSLVEECETTTTMQPKDPETGLPVGDPTTTTTTTSNTTPDSSTKEDQAPDPCLTSPNRVACIELGTPTGEIPTATRSVEYQEESVFGGGTCPADKYVEVRGQQLRITDMAKTCDMLEDYAKPIALLLAAFSALMIVAVGMPE